MPWKDQQVLDVLKDSFDLEQEYTLERDQIHTKKFKDKLDVGRLKHIDQSLGDIQKTRMGIIENNPGVWDAYTQKYQQGPQPQEQPSEGTSPLAGLLRGGRDTAKFVAQHPTRAAAHVGLGIHSLASLPFRLAETGIMGEKGEFPVVSFKRGLKEREEEAGKKDFEAGVEANAGPAVMEAVGGMAVPVGPTLQVGKHLKNILKGAGFAGGISAGEELAQKGDISAEQTGTAAGIGGAITGGLSALLSRGRAKVSAPVDVTPEAPKLLEHNPPIEGMAPPKQLPAPEPEAPKSYYQEMIEKTRDKHVNEMSSDEKGFLLSQRGTVGQNPPPNAAGVKEDIGVVPTRERTLSDVLGRKPVDKALMDKLDAAWDSTAEPEELAAKAAGVTPRAEAKLGPPATEVSPNVLPIAKEPGALAKAMQPRTKNLNASEALTMAKQMDVEHKAAAQEATLKDVISGKKDVKTVPMKRTAKSKGAELPKPEAPAPAVKDEVGAARDIDFFGEGKQPVLPIKPASAKIVQSKPAVQPKEVVNEKQGVDLPRKRTEDFIRESGFHVKEREPFPGEKEYDVIDQKTGNVLARGDRKVVTERLGSRPEAKGLKLYSFPGGVGEFGKVFKDALSKAGARVDDGVDVQNNPHRAGALNTLLRPFETPEFNVRKSEAGRTITDAGREGDRQIGRRVRDLITEEKVPGKEYANTKLHGYFSLDRSARDVVDKVLVLGDREEKVYTPAQLAKHGLNPEQINAYTGVREALDKVVGWVRGMGDEYKEFDSRKIEGYIPRVWKGDWEIHVNGNKYLKPDTQTSSFQTLGEASAEAHKIKTSVPKAKIAIRFFPDPEYLSSAGLQNARVVARLKANLERMGHVDAKAIDEAFAMGKSVKGFAKHLLERKDATGYETQDLDRVLNSYFYQAARRVEMQKVKDVAESVLKEHKADLSAGQVRYMQEYVERVAGKPAWDQIAIHNFVQDTPIGKWIDPVRGGKAITTAKDVVTHLTLGFGNVGWAMINLDGITRHVWPLLAKEAKMAGSNDIFGAEKYLTHGIKEFFTNKALRQQLAHHGVIDIQLMSEPTPKIGHEYGKGHWTPARASMLLGTATEEFSRGVAAIARYKMALDHGATPAQAMSHAARFVEQTLGRYTRGGRPPVFTGAIGSTAGLFKTYMAVMLQNGWRAFESKDVGTIARYITGAVGVSGVIGLIPGIEDMDSALTKMTGWSPIEAMEKNLPPAVATGIGTLAGIDISRRAGVPEIFPNDVKGWAGPVYGRFASVISDIANGEYGEAALDLLPNSIRNVVAVARGYEQGKIIGRLDKPSYSATPSEGALHAIGLTPNKEAADSRLYQRNVNKEAYREDKLGHLTRKIASGRATDEDYARYAELGGKGKRIRNEQRRQNETLVERQYKHLPKILRREQEHP